MCRAPLAMGVAPGVAGASPTGNWAAGVAPGVPADVRPGTYTVTITAVNANGKSAPRKLTFTIVA